MAGAFNGLVQIVGTIDDIKSIVSISTVGDRMPRAGKSVPVAISGTLTTRTSDTQGIVTSTGHGLAGTERLAIFWDGGRCYRCSIDSHTDDTITFTAAAGDALPAIGTGDPPAVTVAVAQQIDELSIDSDDLQELMITTEGVASKGLCEAFDSTPTSLLAEDVTDTASYIWPQSVGDSAPYSGTAVSADLYNGSTSAGVMYLTALLT